MSKETQSLKVQPRSEFGDNASRRFRRAGLIPAVVYGCGKANRTYLVDADQWKVVSGHGAQIVTLLDDKTEIPALVREVQFNYLKNYVVHIDFQEVDLNAEIEAAVAVHPHGEAYGASHGGILEQDVFELPVICRPADLPELIRVDVTKLNIGDALTAAEIELPAGVKTNVAPDTVIFHVVHQQAEVEAPAAAEGEAAAEPEAINEKKTEARAAEKKEAK